APGAPRPAGLAGPGRKAGLGMPPADSPFPRPLSSPVGPLGYAETGNGVDTVMGAGRVVVRGGRVLTIDEARLRASAQAAADSLRGRNPAAWQLAAEIAPYLSQACQVAVAAPYPVNRYAAPVG